MKKSKTDVNIKKLDQASYYIRIGKVQRYIKEQDKKSKILEVGCGRGALSRDIIKMGYENLTLADIENFTDSLNVDLVDVSFEELPYNDQEFDMVLAIAIIEHLENPFLFYRECSRVIKRGGIFIVALPHALSFKSRIKFLFTGNLIGYRENNNHISVLTKAVFKKIVLKDFEIVDIFYGKGHIKIFNKKIRFKENSKFFGKLLSDKILYTLKRK